MEGFNLYDSIEPVAVVQPIDFNRNGHIYYRISGDYGDVITNYKAWKSKRFALHKEVIEFLQQTKYCGVILDNKKEAERKLHNKDPKSYPWSDEDNDIHGKSRKGNTRGSQMVPQQFRTGLRDRRRSGDR